MAAVIEEKTYRGLREVALLGFITLSIYLLIALISFDFEDAGWSHTGNGTGQGIANACGMLGAWLSDFLLSLFGLTAYLFPISVAWTGYYFFQYGRFLKPGWDALIEALGFIFTLISGSALLYLHLPRPKIPLPRTSGGFLGQEIGDQLLLFCGNSGATLLLLATFFASVTALTGLSWFSVIDNTGKYCLQAFKKLLDWLTPDRTAPVRAPVQRQQTVTAREPLFSEPEPELITKPQPKQKVKIEPVVNKVEISQRAYKEKQVDIFKNKDSEAIPSFGLLDEHCTKVKGYSREVLEEMGGLVEHVLKDFGVKVEVVEILPGPVITRFELQLAPGVKVSRVSGLAKDIARALSVTSVRVVEVIPGKPLIGLEIPNKHREMVSLKQVLSSSLFEKSKSNLTLVLGKDIAGVPVVADLAKMPHVLVAGTTGSGKSVAINTMILSMLFKSSPDEVRMIMVDPKMLELSVYEGIPHLLTPVVTDMKEAANALRWSVAEMERRYKLMSKMGVRNLKGFNQLIKDAEKKGEPIRDPLFVLDRELEEGESFPVLEAMPQIVIIIDELADMMMVVGKKVEELIARLAQKARAAGIHLILATQRPSVDVLTGLIKANVPTRISFQVSSRIDSRTVLDQSGAEALLGNGDMLFLPSGTSIPIRAHGAFVDDHEVHKVVEFLKQSAPPNYLEEITQDKQDSADGFALGGNDDAEMDALYDEAIQFVTETRKASISSVQRKFRIGYNRAARLIEDMENAGVVSPPETNGSRVVLAPAPVRD